MVPARHVFTSLSFGGLLSLKQALLCATHLGFVWHPCVFFFFLVAPVVFASVLKKHIHNERRQETGPAFALGDMMKMFFRMLLFRLTETYLLNGKGPLGKVVQPEFWLKFVLCVVPHVLQRRRRRRRRSKVTNPVASVLTSGFPPVGSMCHPDKSLAFLGAAC